MVVKAAPLLARLLFHDVTLFLQAVSDILVDGLEPTAQLRVVISILVDGVDRIPQVVSRCAVGEALNKGLNKSVSQVFSYSSRDR